MVISNARELIVAVRAINGFFSLSLVLFGLVNLLFTLMAIQIDFRLLHCWPRIILWLTRTAFQVIYPQGSLYPGLQYGMLAAFAVVSLCYIISLVFIVFEKNIY